MSVLTIVVGTVLAAGGSLFLGGLLIGLWLGASSRRWPTTEGEVLDSRAEVDPTSDPGDLSYRPKVRYRYRVNDREYVSENLTYKGYSTAQEVVEAMAGRYPTGSQVQVYYHPRHPNRAVLEPGTTLWQYLIPIMLAAGGMATGIALLLGILVPSGE